MPDKYLAYQPAVTSICENNNLIKRFRAYSCVDNTDYNLSGVS